MVCRVGGGGNVVVVRGELDYEERGIGGMDIMICIKAFFRLYNW